MRKEYDFTSAKPNPYIKQLKKAVSIRLEPDVIEYFKQLSLETRIPWSDPEIRSSCYERMCWCFGLVSLSCGA